MKKVQYYELYCGTPVRYWIGLGVLALLVAIGLGSAYYMEHHGHYVTGMSNQVVWGLPHVFAIFLIVAASGALNVASIGSVFGGPLYKPLGRYSGLLAIALLVGGLMILVLDLGRPDRLIVAMTTYNFKSIFAWNIYLYTGFIVIVGAYLWSMMEYRARKVTRPIGFLALFWRIALPLTLPAVAALAIFNFLGNWNAYIWPLIVTSDKAMMTLPVGLAFFSNENSADWHLIMTGATLSVVPLLVIFIIFQRHIIKGIALTGVKG